MTMGDSSSSVMDPHANADVAERYAAGLLAPNEVETFEDHLLLCARCQTDVRLAVGLRRVTRTAPPVARRRWTMVIGGGALLAASITALVMFSGGRDRLRSLGAVREPPLYLGIPVRGTTAPADSLFDAAMDHYTARRFAEAAEGLRAARAAGADSVATTFFLASADLMMGRAKDAVDEFGWVITANAAQYLPEAHFFRAKALLQLGKSAEAVRELNSAAADPTAAMAGHAHALADSVEDALRR